MIRVPSHVLPSTEELNLIKRTPLKIVCGTNLLSPDYTSWSLWKMPRHLNGYHDTIALGVGWGYYSETISNKSRDVYRFVFGRHGIHSVRDSYTESKMKQMGIHNVLNTGCPTLWGLTPEFCATIPHQKADRVVTTLTDYAKNVEADSYMLDVLSRAYDRVYVWPQGSQDSMYYSQLKHAENVELLPEGLEEYTRLLNSGGIDYIGTRLHGGIHAMNHAVRTMIIAVDHRAAEMGKDFSLPYFNRTEIKERLVGEIHADRSTSLNIPWRNIQEWKNQFR